MTNWMELLSIAQLTLSLEHRRPVQKVINIYNPNKKALNKIELFKKHNKKDPQLKEKNKIYLRIKNLKSKRPLKKLNYVKVGSFLVDK